jgi:hypothetical protein
VPFDDSVNPNDLFFAEYRFAAGTRAFAAPLFLFNVLNGSLLGMEVLEWYNSA